ncbi:hypothetical protein P7K49_001029 [Saguinus oedipus]|uniref:TLE family member 1, transcriptional corepressor n=1 Tax=Saguinus oedipus TaxID=9490 RepID=A0ABQ9WDE7_SAGOE|nr:hypothetical protein P7K49_001029 [Saguinus oedipus]
MPTPGTSATPGLRPGLGKPPAIDPLVNQAAAGLRTPLAVPGPYPAPFGMVPHAGMNGELTSPGAAYASLHNMSPQMSAAAAAAAVVAYGRSPMVGCCWVGSGWEMNTAYSIEHCQVQGQASPRCVGRSSQPHTPRRQRYPVSQLHTHLPLSAFISTLLH